MRTSEQTIVKLQSFEKLELKAYKCPAGVWTIGWGHTKGVKPGQVISKEQALLFLKEDLKEVEDDISLRIRNLSQKQFDALVSLVFNIGTTKFHTSTIYRKLHSNPSDPTIADEFSRWKYSNGKVLPGLVTRRAWEAALYREGTR